MKTTSDFTTISKAIATSIERSATTLDLTAASDLIDILRTSESTPDEDATRSELETDTSETMIVLDLRTATEETDTSK